MGIFEWIKAQTGIWGPDLLAMYLQHAGWINALVIVYGLVLLLSWQNLDRIGDSLLEQILTQAQKKFAPKQIGKCQVVHLSEFDLSWGQAFQHSRFPFVARQTGIVIRRSSPENIRAMISDVDLIRRARRKLSKLGLQLEQEK